MMEQTDEKVQRHKDKPIQSIDHNFNQSEHFDDSMVSQSKNIGAGIRDVLGISCDSKSLEASF